MGLKHEPKQPSPRPFLFSPLCTLAQWKSLSDGFVRSTNGPWASSEMGDLEEPPSSMPGTIAYGTGFLAEVSIAINHLGIGELDPVSIGRSGRGQHSKQLAPTQH